MRNPKDLNRKEKRDLIRNKPSHKNSKAGNKQIIDGKVIHHKPKKSSGERNVFTDAEKKLLDIVEKKAWYGKVISKSNAQSIKNNLKQGTITMDRVFSTLTTLGYDIKTLISKK